MAALFKLRATEPEMPRLYRPPLYPWLPGFALIGAAVALGAMIYFNAVLACVYAIMVGWLYLIFVRTRLSVR
jgi:ethanolamine permease